MPSYLPIDRCLSLSIIICLCVLCHTLPLLACAQDEVFHERQTRAYCAGHWGEWDPKITTLPGLYLMGAPFARTLNWLAALGDDPESALLDARDAFRRGDAMRARAR